MRNKIIWLCLFALILIYFVLGSGWYDPARLIIKGTAETTATDIIVKWDSGEGYNNYEQRSFSFQPVRTSKDRMVNFVIEKAKGQHKLSAGNQVLLSGLRVDNKSIDLSQQKSQDIPFQKWYGLDFSAENSTLHMSLPVKHRILFVFKSSGAAGIARIEIEDQNKDSHNLYRRNWAVLYSKINYWFLGDNGDFEVSLNLPRYRISSLKLSGTENTQFSSIILRSPGGSHNIPFELQADGTVLITEPNKHLKRFYHTGRFLFQVVSALFLTSLIWTLKGYLQRFDGVKDLFVINKRWVFWVFLSSALLVYGAWLLAFWPGVMSVDSLNVWRAALLPEVMINDHPFINQVWYLFLSLIWQNIAIVPITHVVFLSAMVAATFFGIYRLGVSWWLIVLCYVLILFSIPIGVYNTTLWKDIPFALLVVFWALFLAYSFMKKRMGEKFSVSKPMFFYLLLLFVALLTFRHNGLIYLAVIPLMFYVLKLVRIPPVVTIIGIAAAAIILYVIVFPPSGIRGASYFRDLSSIYLEKLGDEPVIGQFVSAAKKYPDLLETDKSSSEMDFWHFYLGDRYAYKFLFETGWSDVYKYRPQDKHPFAGIHNKALQIYNKSLEKPWRYFTWSPILLPYIFLLVVILARWFPLSAVFSTVILAQVLALLLIVGTVNWRYYYFFLLGGYFLLPVILLDFHFLKRQEIPSG